MSSPYDRILNDNRHPSDKYSDIPKGRLHGFFDLDNQKKVSDRSSTVKISNFCLYFIWILNEFELALFPRVILKRICILNILFQPRPLRFFAKFAAVVTCVLIIRSICIGDPIFQLSMQQSKEEEERRRKEKEKGISYNPTFGMVTLWFFHNCTWNWK